MSFKDEFLKRRKGEWRKKYKRSNKNHSNRKRESMARELENEICDALAEVESSMSGEIELKTLLEFIDELEKETK